MDSTARVTAPGLRRVWLFGGGADAAFHAAMAATVGGVLTPFAHGQTV